MLALTYQAFDTTLFLSPLASCILSSCGFVCFAPWSGTSWRSCLLGSGVSLAPRVGASDTDDANKSKELVLKPLPAVERDLVA